MGRRLALIDGDMINYKAAFAAEKNLHHVYFEGEEREGAVFSSESKKECTAYITAHPKGKYVTETETVIEPAKNAYHNINLLIEKIMDHTKAKDYFVVLSGSTNFRDDIAVTTPYKGNRWSPERRAAEREAGRWLSFLDETEANYQWRARPYHFDNIRNFLVDYHSANVTDGHEADDELGILQIAGFGKRALKESNATTVIASLDKDLRGIPGFHFDWTKEELHFVSEYDAYFNFYAQLLAGDKQTDNVPGLPYATDDIRTAYGLRQKGVGIGNAQKILEGAADAKEMEERVLEAYMAYFIAERVQDAPAAAMRYMTEQGQLLWIQRNPGELWLPGRV